MRLLSFLQINVLELWTAGKLVTFRDKLAGEILETEIFCHRYIGKIHHQIFLMMKVSTVVQQSSPQGTLPTYVPTYVCT